MISEIESQIQESVLVKEALARDAGRIILQIAERLVDCLQGGNKIILAGNGGSAADAQHIAAELVGRFRAEREALSAIALTTNTSVLTAVGNDYGFEEIFARQIGALGNPGDVLVALSTSGNSPNVLRAVRKAKERGLFTVGLTGMSGGKMRNLVDLCLCVPSENTPRIQEAHILVGHILSDLVDRAALQAACGFHN